MSQVHRLLHHFPGNHPAVARGPRSRLSATLAVGTAIVVLVVLAALLSLFWTPYDPVKAFPTDQSAGLQRPAPHGHRQIRPRRLLGILYGARITSWWDSSLWESPLWSARRWESSLACEADPTEEITMRGADILLAFPALLLAIMFGAVFGASTTTAMVAIGSVRSQASPG